MSNLDLDLDQLLNDVHSTLNALVKSEESSMKEESKEKSKKEESKKEESSKEESSLEKDDEGSGYESQAPEASMDAPAEEPAQEEQAMGDDSEESLEAMVSGLSDEMFMELAQIVEMEKAKRQEPAQSEEAPAAPEMQAPAEEAPAAPQDLAMTYKSEVDTLKAKLEKAEADQADLAKSVKTLMEMVVIAKKAPVERAVTDISYIQKGESLTKSEANPEAVYAKAKAFAANHSKMAKLTKSEVSALSNFMSTKKVTEQILDIVNK